MPSDLQTLREQIAALPAGFAALRDQLPPPQFRAEVERIFGTLGRQVENLESKDLDVADMKAAIVALRAELGA